MRPQNHTLDRRQVHRTAIEHLQAHLKFKDYKLNTLPENLVCSCSADTTGRAR